VDGVVLVLDWPKLSELGAQWMVYQLERSESGVLHHQGIIMMCSPRLFSEMRLVLPGCFLSVTRNVDASISYCSKVATRVAGPYRRGSVPSALPGVALPAVEKPYVFEKGVSLAKLFDTK